MSGIDKIIKQIEDDTKEYCDEILENAQLNAEKTINSAQKEAQDIKGAYALKTQSKLSDISSRTKSSAELEEKKAFLSAKQNVISQMLYEALANAKALPKEEYFALLLRMIEKNALPKDGAVFFSKRDLFLLPEDFKKKLGEVTKGSLTIAKEPIDIDAGFVLSYGGIEENCSFDAVFRSLYDTLSDKASAMLF